MTTFDIVHFNSGTQKEPDFLANFIARQDVLQFFLAQLRHTQNQQSAKHHLIIAPRGYGKTSLLRRIKIALRDETEFKERYIPLSFREEQHNVISLDVFWRNCLQALLEAREDEHARATELDDLDQLWENNAPRNNLKREEQDGAPACTAFVDHCRMLGRRLVLLIDNLDALLAGLVEQHQWGLRTELQKPDGPVLIAAASRYPESLNDTKAAFFDFFRIFTMSKLGDHEVMSCLRELARMRGEKGAPIRQMLETDPGRISALNTMAGGNPRTLGVLYMVLEAHMSDDVLAQLSSLLDSFTGWYQARTEELPLQSRAVFDALALNWDPMTAADIGKITGLDTPTVSSHLSRLEKSGYAETVALSKTKKSRNGYQVSERFFNIWYLMRNGPRRTRQAIKFLTVFLRSCFSKRELHVMAKHKLRNGTGRIESTLALAASIGDTRLRGRLLDTAENSLAQLERADDARALLSEMRKEKKTNIAQRALGTKNQVNQLLQTANQQIASRHFELAEATYLQAIDLDENDAEIWDEFGDLLQYFLGRYKEAEDAYRTAIALDDKLAFPWDGLGDLLRRQERYEEAEAAYRTAIALNNKWSYSWDSLGDLLQYELGRYEEAETCYRHAISLDGQMAGPWGGLGDLLQDKLGRYEEAEAAYRKAVVLNEKWSAPWGRLGDLLSKHLKRYKEAEAAYRQCIALDEKDATPWIVLGNMLHFRLGRHGEAEAAYRRALDLNEKDAEVWGLLGSLLQNHLGRYEEAEAAYRQAIALDEKDARPWSALGYLLLYQLDRYEEAEAAFRKAIALDEKDARPWSALGDLLQYKLERYEEAEAAYRMAIALDEKKAHPWVNLGNLLQYRLERIEEVEATYRKAIALDEKDAAPWGGLGDLFRDHLDRYEEAETAYHKAIALDEKWAAPWGALGSLLQYQLGRYEEAETAYRKEIALDGKNAYDYNTLGNLLQDYLGRYEDSLLAYEQGMAIDPGDSILLANCAYLCALHLGQSSKAANYAKQIEADLSPAGRHLMNSMLAWSSGYSDAASRGWSELHMAMSCADETLWSNHSDDLQRVLAYATVRGDGEAVRNCMVGANYSVEFAPLYHAYCAMLDGEDYLLSINPEVRGMAEKIYRGLARMVGLFKCDKLPTKHKPSISGTRIKH